MIVSECSYCGSQALTENGVCAVCAAFITPPAEPAETHPAPPANEYQPSPPVVEFQMPPADFAPASAAPRSEFQPPPAFSPSPAFPPPPRRAGFDNGFQPPPVMDARCVRCKTMIPRGQTVCADCANKKSPRLKVAVILMLLIAAAGYFGFDYVYAAVSPRGVFRKYAKTTGADDSLVFDGYSMKGEARVTFITDPNFNANTLDEGMSLQNMDAQRIGQFFSLQIVYKKPNLSGVELTQGAGAETRTVFKEVFDGARGWSYTNMPNQPAGYQEKGDGFPSKKMGLGMEEYDSAAFIDPEIQKEYGVETIKLLSEKKGLDVAGVRTPSETKTIVKAVQKQNGRDEASLLVFDEKTGLLLGMIKKEAVNGAPVTTTIFFNNYDRFSVKRSGLFGTGSARVLVPTRITLVMSRAGDPMAALAPPLMIDLNVKSIDTETPVDDKFFQRQ
ncbi:MAG: hypothetical protein JSS81_14770 [Acidobacteria bacterium]|nr:hypothetical protein [Acidobacteriota bacterium]